jgi:hypothetical protein
LTRRAPVAPGRLDEKPPGMGQTPTWGRTLAARIASRASDGARPGSSCSAAGGSDRSRQSSAQSLGTHLVNGPVPRA